MKEKIKEWLGIKKPKDVFKKVDKMDMSRMSTRENGTVIDPLIRDFTATVKGQQQKVLMAGKYEHPVHRDNHTLEGWIRHQEEELADALVYHQCIKQKTDEIRVLVSMAKVYIEIGKTERAVEILADVQKKIK